MGLCWGDVDLTNGRLRIQRVLQRYDGGFHLDEPKTSRSRRTVTLPRPVVEALRRHRTRQIADRLAASSAWSGTWGDLVFATEMGEPLHGTSVGKRFRKLTTAARMPDLKYHHLRHGAASLMAAQGVPPRVAMEVLGHADIATTMNVYSHVAPESQQIAAERMEAAI